MVDAESLLKEIEEAIEADEPIIYDLGGEA